MQLKGRLAALVIYNGVYMQDLNSPADPPGSRLHLSNGGMEAFIHRLDDGFWPVSWDDPGTQHDLAWRGSLVTRYDRAATRMLPESTREIGYGVGGGQDTIRTWNTVVWKGNEGTILLECEISRQISGPGCTVDTGHPR